ncbi:hypothetical protein Tco_0179699 [Tanacetum coccineum]
MINTPYPEKTNTPYWRYMDETVGTVEQEYEPTTAKEKQDRRNEMKVRATLLMALPNKDQLKFHSYQDAKLLMEAIEKMYGGNKESRSQPNSPQLAKKIWNNFILMTKELCPLQWEKPDADISSIESFQEIRRTKEERIIQELLQWRLLLRMPLISSDGIIEMNGATKLKKRQTTYKSCIDGIDILGNSSSSELRFRNKVEARLAHYKKNEAVFEESINVLKLKVRLRDNALNEYKMNLEKAKKRKRSEMNRAATAASPAVESFVNLTDKSGSDKGYQSVPPPLSGNFIPRKPDLTFIDEIVESENMDVTTVISPSNVKTVENKGVSNTVESNTVRMNNSSAPIIEDWNSDDESEIDYIVRPSI